jgi:putative colanic acid biosynthesis UDP-glucose lipid carrier transferase
MCPGELTGGPGNDILVQTLDKEPGSDLGMHLDLFMRDFCRDRMALASALISSSRKTSPTGRSRLLGSIETWLDSVVLVSVLWLLAVFFDGDIRPDYLLLSVLLFALTFPGPSRIDHSPGRLIGSIALNWLWIASLLFALGYSSHYLAEFSGPVLVTWVWLAPLVLLSAHLSLHAAAPFLVALQGPPRRAIIVGVNGQGMALAQSIKADRYQGLVLNGIFDDREIDRREGESIGEFPLLGKLLDLPGYVKAKHIQLIYLSLPMTAQPRILQLLDELKDTTASIYFVPDMFVTDLIQGRSGSACGIPVIAVCESPFTGSNGSVKRASDFVLALLILLLISPLLLLIAAAVKIGSPGPVIFKQRRYGLDGEEILVYKFRSMSVCEDGGAIRQAQRNDSRITPLGAFLRKSSLDELPQFINVLQGRMSIVGPRPHAVAHNELYRTLIKGYMIRHKVKPGITGWAQVNGYRGETDTLAKMQGRIDYDLEYLRHWSLALDLRIILKTLQVVINDRAAY